MEHGLRVERDRFVAFAFCDADILLELDRAQNVVFAAGATVALMGLEPEDLRGRDIFEFVSEDQHRVVREIMRMADGGARIEPVLVRLRGRNGVSPPLALTGFQLPDVQGHYFLALRMGIPAPPPVGPATEVREPESGLFDPESFTEVATKRLKAIRDSDQTYRYSVFQLGGFSALRARLDEERRAQLLATIGESLRARSLYGDSAGRVDDERFGLIHGPKTALGDIRSEIEESSRALDPQSRGVQVRSASVDLDCEGMSEADALNAFAYTINTLNRAGDPGKAIRTLSEGLTAMVGETAAEMAKVRDAVKLDRFEILYQPIVDLETGKPHHFEVLSRMDGAGLGRSPSEFFRFAEDVGIVREFDLACCRRALETLTQTKAEARLSVNLSSSSLRDPEFISALFALLDENRATADRLFFDIKEKVIISDLILAGRIIADLRRRGHKVCVDNFGAGAPILHYMRNIEIDMVKVDSRYIRDALAIRNGEVFLNAIAHLCRGLGVMTIAAMVEDQSSVTVIHGAGIRYAQGYLFGGPAKEVDRAEVA